MRNRSLIYSGLLAGLTLVLALGLTACGGSEEPAGETAGPATGEPAATPAAQGPAGPTGTASITGTVTYTGQVPELRPLNMNADPDCQAKHDAPVKPDVLVLGDGNSLGNIFVKVKNHPQGSYPAPSEPTVVDQDGCRYIPHVAAVMAGQPLKFMNSDGILHNVHGLPKENREFNLGMPASLTEKDVVLNQPEPLFPVKCDVHPWMQAYVAVMSHPFYDITENDGQFTIDNLPAGTYEVEAWHERMGTKTASVTVADGEAATVDFSFEAPSS